MNEIIREKFDEFFTLINSRIKLQGLTQKKIANMMGLSESMLSKILSGQRKIEIDKLILLSDLLNINKDNLIEIAQLSGILSITSTSEYKLSFVSTVIDGVQENSIKLFKNGADDIYNADYRVVDDEISPEILAQHTSNNLNLKSLLTTLRDFANRHKVDLNYQQELLKRNIELLDVLLELKDYRKAIEYSLEESTSEEIIKKIIKYIDVEINTNKKP